MSFLRVTALLVATASAFSAQGNASTEVAAQLPAHATLPITFTKTINGAKARPGDPVEAKTLQAIRLADGRELPAGTPVTGHVLAATAFRYDSTPYAKQSAGVLDIQIDSLKVQGAQIPLHVALRAMADPVTSWHAHDPLPNDPHAFATTTQVGGDLSTPSQAEITNADGDVVGYNKRGGAFAHLIANSRGSLHCDAGETEQPVSIFSASACGLYGFVGVSLGDSDGSHIALSSTHGTPLIWKSSTALLEAVTSSADRK